ncbi:MAG: hypothetical protein Q7R88_00340 [bacterium]|nr:hypothetical protein [bacterium]
MEKLKTPDLAGYIELLAVLFGTGNWTARVLKRCIHLYHVGSDEVFSPTTALHYHLTAGAEKIGRGFFYEEFSILTGMPWWLMLEISYAEIACDCGRQYDRRLRNRILEALGQPAEKIPWG